MILQIIMTFCTQFYLYLLFFGCIGFLLLEATFLEWLPLLNLELMANTLSLTLFMVMNAISMNLSLELFSLEEARKEIKARNTRA